MLQGSLRFIAVIVLLITVIAGPLRAGNRLLKGTRVVEPVVEGEENHVKHPCLTPMPPPPLDLPLERRSRWALPAQALPDDFEMTLNCLVLRYNFQHETVDDPNTTGRGTMDLSQPLATPADSAEYYNRVGHWIDPPPHDSVYFDAHMRALRAYYEMVSKGKLTLTWDIYPPVRDSVYQLPREMAYYGLCDSVIVGLERYFVDCIHLADSVHILDPAHPDIDFSQYQAIFLFHAGADRQNDIGFPETCNDLFTGFILFGDSVAVDGGTGYVRTALMMPEAASQDNRATALNAVMAHEFGHQLGLIDLYRTDNFLTQLGDFALMDNNGFGTGIDFGFDVGRVFGAIPLYPCAWSRAYLGFTDVVDFRQGSDVRVVAAEVMSQGIQIARVPISENRYYLIENRLIDTDQLETFSLADSTTNVILGPVNAAREFTGEYDFLMPGSGVIIYLVDEAVAAMDFDNDGLANFDDNDVQNDRSGIPPRRFISVVEADGRINFGGLYRAGFGSEDDMYREDRNHALTPNTNPPAFDNTGNNTHIYITNIRRDTADGAKVPMDTVVLFDVETDRLASGFPVRAGVPLFGLSPIADDLDRDGTDEVIFASGRNLLAVTSGGANFLRETTGCTTCPLFVDTVAASVHPGHEYVLPLYVRLGSVITAGPVTGDFGQGGEHLVAVGIAPTEGQPGLVQLHRPADVFSVGQADLVGSAKSLFNAGTPIALSFGESLWILTDSGFVYHLTTPSQNLPSPFVVTNEQYHGICRLGDRAVVVAGDSIVTTLYAMETTIDSFSIDGMYSFGPAVGDLDLDGQPEIVLFSPDGDGVFVTADTSSGSPQFSILRQRSTGFPVRVNPIVTDLDRDGRPDVAVGGINQLIAFNRELTLKTGFPIEIDDRFVGTDVIAAPVSADFDAGSAAELVVPTQVGNIYSYGDGLSYGFPLSGGERGIGSAVIFHDSTGGYLGYVGIDGWFYAWEINVDTSAAYWPMGGADPGGSFALNSGTLDDMETLSTRLPEDRFYNYPNPVVDGTTNIRYYLSEAASRVVLTIYDLSGREIAALDGPTSGGIDNEVVWVCGDVTPGVYRCVIDAQFDGGSEVSHTDIAIIR